MQDILDKIKVASARALSRRVNEALLAAHSQIEAQTSAYVGAKLPAIAEQAPATVQRFKQNLYEYFDQLGEEPGPESDKPPEVTDSISLLDHDYIEAMIAMEGMTRKMHEKEILGEAEFLDRLGPLFPGIPISQKNNPLDPEQVGDCFNQAIRPLGLQAHFLLTIYREFNKNVFANFEDILNEINRLLAALEETPSAPSSTSSNTQYTPATPDPAPEERLAAAPGKQLPVAKDTFANLSTLLTNYRASDSRPELPLAVASDALTAERNDDVYLTLQRALSHLESDNTQTAKQLHRINNEQVQSTIDSITSGTSPKLDRQSCSCLCLVSLFYENLLADRTLSEANAQLLIRTQITISRAALAEFDFFNDAGHPGRTFLDEIARLGIAWSDNSSLASNPDYIKANTLVNRLGSIETTDRSNLQSLTDELLDYVEREAKIESALAQRLQNADDPDEIQNEVDDYIQQKLADRIFDQNLDPAIRSLLSTHLHNALIKILGNEGPRSKAWKAVMQTIDVMLWSVKQDKQPDDARRFAKIKDRLATNIEKAMEFSAASKTKIRRALRQLKQVQEYTFLKAESHTGNNAQAGPIAISNHEPPALPLGHPALQIIDEATVGSWFQFPDTNGNPVRLQLAVRIDSIEKFIFRDSKDTITLELSRDRLATALKNDLVLSLGGGPQDESISERAIRRLYTRLSLSQ